MSLKLDVVKENILINETQLGEQLNESLHSARRSDFSLMLAMLTDDVMAHGQFHQPETKKEQPLSSESLLRKSLHLPKEVPLALAPTDNLSIYNQAAQVEANQTSDIHLQNALHPVPLAFRDDVNHIPTDVLTNTSIYCQLKQSKKNKTEDKSFNQRLSFNAKAWLDGIQTSLVKSPMLSV